MQTALSYVQAPAHDLSIGSVVPIQLTIENLGIATPGVAEIQFPPDSIIGAVMHEDQMIVPKGDTQIRPGDRVVVFTLANALTEVESLFK